MTTDSGVEAIEAEPGSPLTNWIDTMLALDAALVPLNDALPRVRAATEEFNELFRAHAFTYETYAQHNWNAMLHLPSNLHSAIQHIERIKSLTEKERPILSAVPLERKQDPGPHLG